ncbi:MAG: serine/threonine-protein kinase [Polyangiales bacterium]
MRRNVPTQRGLDERWEDPAHAPMLGPSAMVLDRYRVVSLIGVGSMGQVYRARHLRLGHLVAVKVCPLYTDPLLVRRLEAEAALLARLRHPNVVSVLDFGQLPGGVPTLVMELIEGESLQQRLKREGSLPWPEASSIARKMLEGLEAVHAANVLHRDLKPGNVLLPRVDASLVKLVDFGVACPLERDKNASTLSQNGEVVGTVTYMSPEQLQVERLDRRTDVYSLACVLYEMLSGRVPYPGTLIEGALVKMRGGAPNPLTTPKGRPEIPPALVALVMRALSPNRDARPPTARAFAESLRAIEAEARAPAPPPQADFATRPTALSDSPRAPRLVAVRLPKSGGDGAAERAWVNSLVRDLARPVPIGPDELGILLNDETAGHARRSDEVVRALTERYGEGRVAQTDVGAPAEGGDVSGSMLDAMSRLIERLASQSR